VTELSLALISDLHLPVAAPPRLGQLLSKRGLSWLSWVKKRSKLHRPEVLSALMADLAAAAPDHLLICGDLTNLALPGEFADARAWLKRAGRIDTVTVVPGNHDALVPVPWVEGMGRWADWMSPDPGANTPQEPFPFVRVRGPAALVGLSTAVPTAPGLATGHLGEAQLDRLRATLLALKARGLFRIVALHHPITPGAVSKRKQLTDQAALRAVLAETGAELVVHGHAHEASLHSVPGPDGAIPVIGVGSASQIHGAGHNQPAGWRLFRISSTDKGWRCAVETRRLTAAGGFESLGTYVLTASTSALSADCPAASPCRSDSAA
jgi:3',5'-cyclic AMP phosphodiesterase CpdA